MTFTITYNCGEPLLGETGTHQIEIPGGSSALGVLRQGTHGYAEYKEAHRVSFCSLWMTKENLTDFLYKIHPFRTGLLPLQGDRDCGYQACRMDVREDCIIRKLIHGLVPGQDYGLNALMIESHVLELVSLKLECLTGWRNPRSESLSRTDICRLMQARSIILSRLESPPSLLELARLIQMNDCKLKKTFKLYFGKTVYEFIRNQRLEKAFHLITEKKYNVSQSAFSVGYTNLSHFAQAFKERFGIYPSELLPGKRPASSSL